MWLQVTTHLNQTFEHGGCFFVKKEVVGEIYMYIVHICKFRFLYHTQALCNSGRLIAVRCNHFFHSQFCGAQKIFIFIVYFQCLIYRFNLIAYHINRNVHQANQFYAKISIFFVKTKNNKQTKNRIRCRCLVCARCI